MSDIGNTFWERNNFPVVRKRLIVSPEALLIALGIFVAFVIIFWPRPTIVKKVIATKTVTHTITKTVTINQLTAAQNAYISQCEKSENNDQDHGIPDVHSATWTCSYADGPNAQ